MRRKAAELTRLLVNASQPPSLPHAAPASPESLWCGADNARRYRAAGYAVTCVYGLPDPAFARLTFLDVIDAVAASPQPTILVLQQKFPPYIAAKVGLAGGNMVSALNAVGCVGLISNGPSRDLDEVRPLRFQYMLSGVTAGHRAMAVHAINVPVSVGGMDVSPGEIVHMDENGAVKFPAVRLAAVVANARALQIEETARMRALQQATGAAEVRAIMSGQPYAAADQPPRWSRQHGDRPAVKRTQRAAPIAFPP